MADTYFRRGKLTQHGLIAADRQAFTTLRAAEESLDQHPDDTLVTTVGLYGDILLIDGDWHGDTTEYEERQYSYYRPGPAPMWRVSCSRQVNAGPPSWARKEARRRIRRTRSGWPVTEAACDPRPQPSQTCR